MKNWIKSWVYHKCLKVVLRICRKDSFYACLLIGEAELLRGEMKIPTRVLDAAELFVATTRRDLRG